MVIKEDPSADHNRTDLEMEEKQKDEKSTLQSESNLHEIFVEEEVHLAPDCGLQETPDTRCDQTETGVNDTTALWIHKFTKRNKNWLTLVKILTVLIVYSVIGAYIFLAIEGEHERHEMIVINKEKHIFLTELFQLATNQTALKDKQGWILEVFKHLNRYEKQLYASYHESNVVHNERHKWEIWNSLFYCGTVYTTIGYGHITPSTDLGRAITIVYALIGIPIFLLLLTDSGQLLAQVLNWMWAYMRKLYLKSSIWWKCKTCCKRQTSEDCERTSENGVVLELDNCNDQLDLPLSVALIILITYMFVGANIYNLWEEEWSFFESFYFVFISMSTIGFGDYIPKHPIYMMTTILYLVFGLALMAMCVNVMQMKLTEISRKIITSIRTKRGETIFCP